MSKILYIGGFELPDRNAAAQRVLGNAKALRALGNEVILIGMSKFKTELNEARFVEGFKFYEYKYPQDIKEWFLYLSNTSFLKDLIKKEKGVIAIIAYNYPSIALYKLKFFGLKVFSDCTEWYLAEGSFIFRAIKNIDVFIRMKYVNKKVDGVIAISDYLENYYTPYLKTINIPPLVDIQDSKWVSINNIDNVEKKQVTFIYSGSPGNGQKDNLEKVISLITDYADNLKKDCKLLIAGISKEQFLNQNINSQGLISKLYNVEFCGRLSHLDSLDLIKRCDYFIFLRDNNLVNIAGFPTKFVEAISLGIPVITNKSSNLETYFVKFPRIGFLIDNLQPNEFCLKLENFNQLINKGGAEGCNIFYFKNYLKEFSYLISDNVEIS